ncbi:type IV pilus biogenesis protein PilM [Metabacillus malikii]|uniref:Type IV pilus assembly protein PilM n=1 Tax=Metabacillus malikii TaxID=1504265 RepID=A0ABT9ZLP2_9BACI|nr:pilus assembly protein PilM [Metabacillus malikii]MDQ0232819.1 type IV pilus assembly protein PilM [Metabacillus malikii]
MAISFNRKIGNLVIKDHMIRYAELKQGTPIVLNKCEERQIPPGMIVDGRIKDETGFSLLLDDCVTSWGIKGRSVRFNVPDSHVVIRKIQIPIDVEDDEIRGYLYVEMGSTIHLPFDEVVFDYVPLTKNNKMQSILLVASSEQLVQQYTDLLSSVKLKPIVADISSLCCFRLLHRNGKKSNDLIFLIQFDVSSVNLTIFNDHKPEFMRHLYFENEEAGHHSANEWDDILKEIEHVLNFYRFSLNDGEQEINQFILTGDHPNLLEFNQFINSRFERNVTLLANEIICSLDKTPIPYTFHLPAGLALKEVE